MIPRKIATKFIWLNILLVIGTIYYLLFSRSIAMPQMGWWQYFGWRITEGDIPYKDFYLYLPPYHTFYVALLYKVFKNHIIAYTIWGLLVNKIVLWGVIYLILCLCVIKK